MKTCLIKGDDFKRESPIEVDICCEEGYAQAQFSVMREEILSKICIYVT